MRRVEEKPGQNPGRTGCRSPAHTASQLGRAGTPSGCQHLQDRQTLHQATWRFTSNERIPIPDAMQGPLRWLFRQRRCWKKHPLVVSTDEGADIPHADAGHGGAWPGPAVAVGKLPRGQAAQEPELAGRTPVAGAAVAGAVVGGSDCGGEPRFWKHGVGFVGEGFGPAFREGEIVVSGDARRSCRGIGSRG